MDQIPPLHYSVCTVSVFLTTFQILTYHCKHQKVAKSYVVLMVIQYINLYYFDRKSGDCLSHVSYQVFLDQAHR